MATEGKIFTYLPASIIGYLQQLEDQKEAFSTPATQTFTTSVLFADVSGFTMLCEEMAKKGPAGDEYLAEHLNSYFGQLVKTISSQGGDVFKFAGDAILVIWPPQETQDVDLITTTRRAFQCALEISRKLQNADLAEGVTLNVKIGVGIGEVKILHVGGVYGRVEYVAVGKSLVQAFASEHHCDTVEKIFVSPPAWDLVKEYFKGEVKKDGFVYLQDCHDMLRKVNITSLSYEGKISSLMRRQVSNYVPSAIQPYVSRDQEFWAGELRVISVLFVNVGMEEHAMQDVNFVQQVLKAVQSAVYKFEGSLNKFLMDDKGSTLLAAFGLPPLAHENDAIRGVVSAMEIVAQLKKIGLTASIGITTGSAYCGVIGPRTRREYSILGDTVNLSARLMQAVHVEFAGKSKDTEELPIYTDTATQYAAREAITFINKGRMAVKGKKDPIQYFRPDSTQKSYMPRQVASSFLVGHNRSRYSISSLINTKTGVQIIGMPLTNHFSVEDVKQIAQTAVQQRPSSPQRNSGGQGARTRAMSHAGHDISRPRISAVLNPSGPPMQAPNSPTSRQQSMDSSKGMGLEFNRNSRDSVTGPLLLSTLEPRPRRRSTGDYNQTSRKLTNKAMGLALILLPRDLSMTLDLRLVETVLHVKEIIQETFPRLHKGEFGLGNAARLWVQNDEDIQELADNVTIESLAGKWFRFWELGAAAPPESVVITFQMLADGVAPEYAQLRKSREIILQSLYNVSETNRSGLVVVEGDIGLGKSFLLTNVMAKAPTPIFSTKGSPLTALQPFSVWKHVLWAMLDDEIVHHDHSNHNEGASPRTTTTQSRADYVRELLTNSPKKETVALLNLAPALADFMELPLAQNPTTLALDEKARTQTAEKVMLAVVEELARSKPRTLAFDDAGWMDRASWRLCLAVNENVHGVLLILLTRPLNKSTLGAFMDFPSEYSALLKKPHTVRIQVKPRPDDEIYRMACEAIPGVESQGLPGILGNFLLTKACGNPLVVKELMYDLVKRKQVTVSMEGEIKVADGFIQRQVPIPHSLKTALGSQLDRLTRLQSMILKVAAVVGDEFSMDVVNKSFPLAIKQERDDFFRNELKTLERMRVVRLVDSSDNTYAFGHAFMRELLLSRMLEAQRIKLKEKVQSVTSKFMARKSLMMDGKAKMEGELGLRILDGEGKHTPAMYFALQQKMLCWWVNKAAYTRKDLAKGMMPLRNSRVTRVPVADRVIQVFCKTWFRDGQFEDSEMTFQLDTADQDSFEDWMHSIQETIGEIMQSQNMSATMISTLYKMSQEKSSSERSVHVAHASQKKQSLAPGQIQKLQKRMQTMLDAPQRNVVKMQLLSVMKQDRRLFSDTWKKRWLTLTSDPPLVWLHRRHVETGKDKNATLGGRGEKPGKFADEATQVINLGMGFVKVSYLGSDKHSKKVKSYNFKIEFQLWTKRRSVKWDRRRVTFGCASEEEAQHWVDDIKRVVKTMNPLYKETEDQGAHLPRLSGKDGPHTPRKRAWSWDLTNSPAHGTWIVATEQLQAPSPASSTSSSVGLSHSGSGRHKSSFNGDSSEDEEDDGTFEKVAEMEIEDSHGEFHTDIGVVPEQDEPTTSDGDIFVV
eukprot:gb/GEZN01000274.1/.p1 GENE.gb/GEZN01000274.1/~~gb/GEZN01000274.1/.p1  ORF type:complete len:1599 (+),score=219.44 gb/GEZN01000274.1/:94-4890(+)